MVDNHFKNWEKAIVTVPRACKRKQYKSTQYHVPGVEEVEGHALGTRNMMQNSRQPQRKKSVSIKATILQLIVDDLEGSKDKIIQCEEKGRLHAVG